MTFEARDILIVDDEPTIRRLLNEVLSGHGYRCQEAGNSEEALEKMRQKAFSLVLLDNKMPGKSGIDLLPEIRSAYADTVVIMTTATTDVEVVIECIRRGAYDYVTKPLSLQKVELSVQRALEKRWLELENRDYQQNLESKVAQQSKRIRDLYLNAITALATALEAKDGYTSGHSQRVAEISAAIAKQLGLPQQDIDRVHLAGLVHDIGKIGVRESVLNKPTGLSEDEVQHARRHPEIGERILVPIGDDEGILQLVRSHHEHYNGTGYPDGLVGEAIPLGARILAVSDAYEAMTSDRAYRGPLTEEGARAELLRHRGTQFDPNVVDSFLSMPPPPPRPRGQNTLPSGTGEN